MFVDVCFNSTLKHLKTHYTVFDNKYILPLFHILLVLEVDCVIISTGMGCLFNKLNSKYLQIPWS